MAARRAADPRRLGAAPSDDDRVLLFSPRSFDSTSTSRSHRHSLPPELGSSMQANPSPRHAQWSRQPDMRRGGGTEPPEGMQFAGPMSPLQARAAFAAPARLRTPSPESSLYRLRRQLSPTLRTPTGPGGMYRRDGSSSTADSYDASGVRLASPVASGRGPLSRREADRRAGWQGFTAPVYSSTTGIFRRPPAQQGRPGGSPRGSPSGITRSFFFETAAAALDDQPSRPSRPATPPPVAAAAAGRRPTTAMPSDHRRGGAPPAEGRPTPHEPGGSPRLRGPGAAPPPGMATPPWRMSPGQFPLGPHSHVLWRVEPQQDADSDQSDCLHQNFRRMLAAAAGAGPGGPPAAAATGDSFPPQPGSRRDPPVSALRRRSGGGGGAAEGSRRSERRAARLAGAAAAGAGAAAGSRADGGSANSLHELKRQRRLAFEQRDYDRFTVLQEQIAQAASANAQSCDATIGSRFRALSEVISSADGSAEEGDEVFRCLICYEVAQAPRQCPSCGRLCCLDCIRRWLESKSNCPHCRNALTMGRLVRARWLDDTRALLHQARGKARVLRGEVWEREQAAADLLIRAQQAETALAAMRRQQSARMLLAAAQEESQGQLGWWFAAPPAGAKPGCLAELRFSRAEVTAGTAAVQVGAAGLDEVDGVDLEMQDGSTICLGPATVVWDLPLSGGQATCIGVAAAPENLPEGPGSPTAAAAGTAGDASSGSPHSAAEPAAGGECPGGKGDSATLVDAAAAAAGARQRRLRLLHTADDVAAGGGLPGAPSGRAAALQLLHGTAAAGCVLPESAPEPAAAGALSPPESPSGAEREQTLQAVCAPRTRVLVSHAAERLKQAGSGGGGSAVVPEAAGLPRDTARRLQAAVDALRAADSADRAGGRPAASAADSAQEAPVQAELRALLGALVARCSRFTECNRAHEQLCGHYGPLRAAGQRAEQAESTLQRAAEQAADAPCAAGAFALAPRLDALLGAQREAVQCARTMTDAVSGVCSAAERLSGGSEGTDAAKSTVALGECVALCDSLAAEGADAKRRDDDARSEEERSARRSHAAVLQSIERAGAAAQSARERQGPLRDAAAEALRRLAAAVQDEESALTDAAEAAASWHCREARRAAAAARRSAAAEAAAARGRAAAHRGAALRGVLSAAEEAHERVATAVPTLQERLGEVAAAAHRRLVADFTRWAGTLTSYTDKKRARQSQAEANLAVAEGLLRQSVDLVDDSGITEQREVVGGLRDSVSRLSEEIRELDNQLTSFTEVLSPSRRFYESRGEKWTDPAAAAREASVRSAHRQRLAQRAALAKQLLSAIDEAVPGCERDAGPQGEDAAAKQHPAAPGSNGPTKEPPAGGEAAHMQELTGMLQRLLSQCPSQGDWCGAAPALGRESYTDKGASGEGDPLERALAALDSSCPSHSSPARAEPGATDAAPAVSMDSVHLSLGSSSSGSGDDRGESTSSASSALLHGRSGRTFSEAQRRASGPSLQEQCIRAQAARRRRRQLGGGQRPTRCTPPRQAPPPAAASASAGSSSIASLADLPPLPGAVSPTENSGGEGPGRWSRAPVMVLGVESADGTLGIHVDPDLVVRGVVPGGAAQRAGVTVGQRLSSVAGQAVRTPHQALVMMRRAMLVLRTFDIALQCPPSAARGWAIGAGRGGAAAGADSGRGQVPLAPL
eukprot:TRINITY_DN12158_c0_g1_i1.p1 TRINITY_DN12158_c0_g1~~TRINITY_DN12158_c0_g1_i1.p1  ORF type:complete len:1710 (+),score=306.62 TRINITY_DN12158_c0_g1_i1:119-5131(+)